MSEVAAAPKDGRYDFAIEADTCWLEVVVVAGAIGSMEINCQP